MEYKFTTQQFLPISVSQAWDFFASPHNLALITPPELDFKILSNLTHKGIYEGMHIEYTIKPLFGIPMKWKTEIGDTLVHNYFTDKQIKGPYAKWEHLHSFSPQNNGVLMTDLITYRLPFGILGDLMHWVIVEEKIDHIFQFRRDTLTKLFSGHAD